MKDLDHIWSSHFCNAKSIKLANILFALKNTDYIKP